MWWTLWQQVDRSRNTYAWVSHESRVDERPHVDPAGIRSETATPQRNAKPPLVRAYARPGASEADRGDPHGDDPILDDRASHMCARGRVSPFFPVGRRYPLRPRMYSAAASGAETLPSRVLYRAL